MSETLRKLSSDHWAVLCEAILSDLDGLAWLATASGQVLLANSSARRFQGRYPTSSDKSARNAQLPTLKGPETEISLSDLTRDSFARNEAVTLKGVELQLDGDCAESVGIHIVPIRTDDEATVALVTVKRQPVNAELVVQQLQEQSLQSLTELAAKIAHELNNPLDGSLRYISLAIRRLQQNTSQEALTKTGEYLSSAQDALNQIHQILSDLGKFARDGQSTIENISVNELLEQSLKTLELRAHSAKINVITSLSAPLPRAGGPKLYQVFCNLIKNAIDAIEERRRLDPTCPAMINICTTADGEQIRIVLEDTGIGLPAEESEIFQPFFTTKADHDGTGLGLAIVREIVEDYGGCVYATAGPGGGARFVVELPIVSALASSSDASPDRGAEK